MQATVVTCRDPFRPQVHRTVQGIRHRRRIRSLAPKTNQPFIAILNGRPVMRAEWSRKLNDRDLLAFVMLPQGGGGGGSNPMRIILTLVVAYFAPMLAGQMLGTTAAAAAAAGGATAMTFTAVQVGISMAGMALVNALIPPPKPNSVIGGSSLGAPSPTYSLQAQGNQGRLDQPIPVLYGRNQIYPDFAAQPYLEYSGNEQFLYQLHLIGQGEHDIEAIRIEDTPIANFSEITYEIVQPGDTVTLFPTQVVTSIEVAGQELTWNGASGDVIGPFVANAADTLSNTIGVDIVFPRGMYSFNQETGQLSGNSAAWTVEYRKINDNGDPVGAWVSHSETFSGATTTPQRVSFRYPVDDGRYEVKAYRTDAKSTSSSASNEISWGGLRSYLVGGNAYGDVTLLAMRMQASNNLSSQASRKINVICTRKLPMWNGVTETWSSPTATSNPIWALADIARAQYGARLVDDRLDLATMGELAATLNARGDECNLIFDSQATIWDAMTTVARTGRMLPFVQGGILRFVRDQPESLPVAMFTPRNILRNSMVLSYSMPSEETADAIDVEYFDSTVWKWKTVRAALPDSLAETVVKIKIPGITSRNQAWREGVYMAACNRYRRRFVSLSTEMDGFIPAMGDLVTVTHDLPVWGQSSEVVDFDEVAGDLELADVMEFSTGTHYLSWRSRSGKPVGPFIVVPTSDPYVVRITNWDGLTDPYPDFGMDSERSHVAFGKADTQWINARVLAIRPRGMERCDLDLVVDSEFVHEAETGTTPGASAWALPLVETAPVIRGLIAKSLLSDVSTMIIGWAPTPGANNYLIDVSADQVNWTRIGDTTSNNYTGTAVYGAGTYIRVAAVGVVRGPWNVVNYGSSAGYMWNASESTLMWNADNTTLMWSY